MTSWGDGGLPALRNLRPQPPLPPLCHCLAACAVARCHNDQPRIQDIEQRLTPLRKHGGLLLGGHAGWRRPPARAISFNPRPLAR